MSVYQSTGPILEETEYYPFGLTMAGISTVAPLKLANQFKYNGKLLNHKEFSTGGGLDWYSYGFRTYDPQTGRFIQQDPLTDLMGLVTPYQYAFNDPVANIDKNGLIPTSWLCPGSSGLKVFLNTLGNVISGIAKSPLTRAIGKAASTGVKVANHVGQALQTYNLINSPFVTGVVGERAMNSSSGGPDDPLNLGIIGKSKNRMGGLDSKFGNGTAAEINAEELASKSNTQLLAYVKQLMRYGTKLGPTMRPVAMNMFKQFSTGQGGVFSSHILNKEVSNSLEFSIFINKFKNAFSRQLATFGGNVGKILEKPMNITSIAPIFHGHFNGLGITVDAVNDIVVYLDAFRRTGNLYRAKITIIIKDIFGLDKGDIQRYGGTWFGIGRDFKAWWILQHVRGYKPLHTFIKIIKNISGNVP